MNFIYLYYQCRDHGNQRRYNSAVFLNPNDRSAEEVETIIKNHLLDETWFSHSAWGLPDLYSNKTAGDGEQRYHEFVGLQKTEEIPLSVATDLEEFLEKVKKSKY